MIVVFNGVHEHEHAYDQGFLVFAAAMHSIRVGIIFG